MLKKRVSIIGGDLRQLTVGKLLKDAGFFVKLYGWTKEWGEGFELSSSVIDAVDADILIFPMPMCMGSFISTPYSDEQVLLEDILSNISYKSIILGGKIPPSVQDRLMRRKIVFVDYLKREELAIKNAVPTAEGALEIAMHETPITIHGSKCLVTGYGRIAKLLARMLKNLGAKTTVAARRVDARAEAEADGFYTIDTKDLRKYSHDFNIIFNTAPALLFNDEVLCTIDKKTLIIDLASKPGGVDFEAAKKENINALWALSLPGKVAPISAGEIIFETVMNILSEIEDGKERNNYGAIR